MKIALFGIFTAVTYAAVILTHLRELHMFQLNGYKTPEHMRWMKKNFKRYIFPLTLLLLQSALIVRGATIPLIIAFTCFNACFIVINKPGKKFKKPLVYTARVKRLMTTFFILTGIFIAIACLNLKSTVYEGRVWNESHTDFTYMSKETRWCSSRITYILINAALYLTPLLVVLANLINKPIEKTIQNWYINDAKKKLADMPSLHKVGITGSYGKTSMKFYLSELLSSQYETLKTPESFNTPMGVTITIRRDLRPTHQYFICEMGARRVHEIKELCGIADPHDGIITSVGEQHLETFKSIENIINTKFELADHVQAKGGRIYLCGDNEYIRKKAPQYKNVVLYGLGSNNDYRAVDISVSDRGTEFTAVAPSGETCRYSMKLLGEHHVQNMLGAIAYAHGTGIPLEKLVLPVKRIAPVPHRLQLIDKGSGITFIDDAYNSNPRGCRAALNVLGLFDAFRILVTPGMVELGAKQEELNYEFGQEASKACDYIILVGKAQTVPIYNGIRDSGYDLEKVFVAENLSEALAKVNSCHTDKKKIVLLENDLPDNY